MKKNSKLLSVKKTRKKLGVGKTTVYKLISEELISSIKVGRRRLILFDSVEDYIKNRLDGGAQS